MVSAIESIMLTLDDLGSGLRFFGDELGLSIVSDGHASVGLLAAWHHPVHESVRLIELGPTGTGTPSIRLAHFEDPAKAIRVVARGTASAAPFGLRGPRLLDARTAAPTVAPGHVRAAPDNLPWIGSAQRPKRSAEAIRWVWIHAPGEPQRARRFYAEALGFISLPSPSGREPQPCPPELASYLGVVPGELLQIEALRPDHGSGAGVLLFRSVVAAAELPRAAPPHRLGSGGISLMSCRCDDLDGLIERLRPLALEPLAAPSHVGTPQGPARVMAVRGPEEELLEFVEVSD
jgi:hypothetical protein